MSHTPGPWRLSAGYHRCANGEPVDWTIEAPRGDTVAFLSDDNAGPRYERDANARLIAAAPDLLEALDELVKLAGSERDLKWDMAVAKAYVALERARGE